MEILLILIGIGVLLGFVIALLIIKLSLRHGAQGGFKFCKGCEYYEASDVFKQNFKNFVVNEVEDPVFENDEV